MKRQILVDGVPLKVFCAGRGLDYHAAWTAIRTHRRIGGRQHVPGSKVHAAAVALGLLAEPPAAAVRALAKPSLLKRLAAAMGIGRHA